MFKLSVNPGKNVKMVVSHLRKQNLNHAPGRYSGPPKKMPSWLSDGKRNLKIPKLFTNALGRLEVQVEHFGKMKKEGNNSKTRSSPLNFL
mgnify:CR=1 FL=1